MKVVFKEKLLDLFINFTFNMNEKGRIINFTSIVYAFFNFDNYKEWKKIFNGKYLKFIFNIKNFYIIWYKSIYIKYSLFFDLFNLLFYKLIKIIFLIIK